jgi:ubiquinone biosynthesis monooxygenase Coq7
VVAHLEAHQKTLPEEDHRSRAIVEQMRQDEAEHGEAALDLGGTPFPAPLRSLMAASAKLMTETTYRL